MEDKIKYIQDNVNQAAILEQLAEEATEVAQAALKLARVLRKENPTNSNERKAKRNLVEELSDLKVMCTAADVQPEDYICNYKIERWAYRIEDEKQFTITDKLWNNKHRDPLDPSNIVFTNTPYYGNTRVRTDNE